MVSLSEESLKCETTKLQKAIKVGKAEKLIAAIFKELIEYTHYHFTLEEELME